MVKSVLSNLEPYERSSPLLPPKLTFEGKRHYCRQRQEEGLPRVQPRSRRRHRRPPHPQVQVLPAHRPAAVDKGVVPHGPGAAPAPEVGAERVGGVLVQAAGGVVAHVHPQVLQ